MQYATNLLPSPKSLINPIPGLSNYSDDSDEEESLRKKPLRSNKHFLAIDVKSLTLKILEAPYNTPNDKLAADLPDFFPIHTYSDGEIEQLGIVVPEEEMDPDDDNAIFCDKCKCFYRGCCREHPLFWIPDRLSQAGEGKRAEKTKPLFVRVRPSNIPKAGLGAFVELDVPRGFVFGPYEGVQIDDPDKAKVDGYCWEVKTKDNHGYIDGCEERLSNWMRYINHSNDGEQNTIAFQYQGKVFYRCSRPITKGTEILVHYGNNFANELYKDCQRRAVLSAVRPSTKKRRSPKSNPFIL